MYSKSTCANYVYTMMLMLHAVLLVVAHDLLEYRYVDDVVGNLFFLFCSTLCGSRKYPDPHHGGNWKFQGGWGGQRPRKFQKGGGLDHKITFQGVNIISFST